MPGGGLKQRAYSNSGKVVDAPATTMITAEPGGVESLCMATADASCDFKPLQVLRRPVGEYDVLIDMKYCGVCHSDAQPRGRPKKMHHQKDTVAGLCQYWILWALHLPCVGCSWWLARCCWPWRAMAWY